MFDIEMTAETEPKCRLLRTGTRRKEDCVDCTLWEGTGSNCDAGRTFSPDTFLQDIGLGLSSQKKPFTDSLKERLVNCFRMITDNAADRMNHLLRRRTPQRSEAIRVKMT